MASVTDLTTQELHERAASFRDVALDNRDSGCYTAAEENLKCSIGALTILAERDAEKYEPYLYTAWNDLCLLYFISFKDAPAAKGCESTALEIAKRCMARCPSDAVAADVKLFEQRLRCVF